MGFSIQARPSGCFTDSVAIQLPTPRTPITARTRQKIVIVWCSPWCSEFRSGEREGVILASSQRHETSRIATKEPPMGGIASAIGPTQAQTGLGDTATNRHERTRAVTGVTSGRLTSKVSPARLELATFGSGGRRRVCLNWFLRKGLRRRQNGEVLPVVLLVVTNWHESALVASIFANRLHAANAPLPEYCSSSNWLNAMWYGNKPQVHVEVGCICVTPVVPDAVVVDALVDHLEPHVEAEVPEPPGDQLAGALALDGVVGAQRRSLMGLPLYSRVPSPSVSL